MPLPCRHGKLVFTLPAPSLPPCKACVHLACPFSAAMQSLCSPCMPRSPLYHALPIDFDCICRLSLFFTEDTPPGKAPAAHRNSLLHSARRRSAAACTAARGLSPPGTPCRRAPPAARRAPRRRRGPAGSARLRGAGAGQQSGTTAALVWPGAQPRHLDTPHWLAVNQARRAPASGVMTPASSRPITSPRNAWRSAAGMAAVCVISQ